MSRDDAGCTRVHGLSRCAVLCRTWMFIKRLIMAARHLGLSSRIRQVALVAALLMISSFGLHGSNEHRAHVSSDLARHKARKSSIRRRVIVRGADRELDLLASRHRVQILKRLPGMAVVLVNGGELTALSV